MTIRIIRTRLGTEIALFSVHFAPTVLFRSTHVGGLQHGGLDYPVVGSTIIYLPIQKKKKHAIRLHYEMRYVPKYNKSTINR